MAAYPSTQTAVQVLEKTPQWTNVTTVSKDVPVPAPGPGQVLVKVKARPVNPADIFSLMGLYPAFQPQTYPTVPGLEGTGEIVALGPGVTGWSVGQRVIPVVWPSLKNGNGLYKEYAALEADYLVSVPDDVTDEQAAVAVVNPAAAIGLLEAVGEVPAGEYLTITAATSALGKMLLGICKARGIKTIAVVRRRAAFDELKALGATECISLDEDLVARVNEVTGGKGQWAALDCIFGDIVPKLCQATRPFGTVVGYGSMDKPTTTVSASETLFRSLNLRGYWVQAELERMTPAQRQQRLDAVFELFRTGVISSGVTARFPLDQALEGFKSHAESGGKVLLTSA